MTRPIQATSTTGSFSGVALSTGSGTNPSGALDSPISDSANLSNLAAPSRFELARDELSEQHRLVDIIEQQPGSTEAYTASQQLKGIVSGEPMERLVRMLEAKDWNLRVKACWALTGCTDLETQKTLLKLVEFESGRRFGDPHAPQPAQQMLERADKVGLMNTPTRQAMLAEVEQAGNLPHWIFGPMGSKVPVFIFAAEALQGSAHKEICDRLIRLTRSSDKSTRLCAVEGLEGSPFPESAMALVSLISDRESVFRSTIGEKAAYALKYTSKGPDAVVALRQLLNDKRAPLLERKLAAIGLHGEAEAAMDLAKIACGKISLSWSVRLNGAMHRTVVDPKTAIFFRGGIEDLRQTAAESVNPQSSQAVRFMARHIFTFFPRFNLGLDNQDPFSAIAEVLRKSKDDKVVSTLVRYGLRSLDPRVREWTLHALTGNESLDVQTAMAKRLNDRSDNVASSAWHCLHESKHPTIAAQADAYFTKRHFPDRS